MAWRWRPPRKRFKLGARKIHVYVWWQFPLRVTSYGVRVFGYTRDFKNDRSSWNHPGPGSFERR